MVRPGASTTPLAPAGQNASAALAISAAVNDARSHPGEEPVVRNIVQQVDVLGHVQFVAAYTSPALRYERSHSGELDCLEYHLGKFVGVIDDDLAEADVDWRFTSVQELC